MPTHQSEKEPSLEFFFNFLFYIIYSREVNGNPLQYSCLENSTHRGAWWATVHVITKAGHDWATEHILYIPHSFSIYTHICIYIYTHVQWDTDIDTDEDVDHWFCFSRKLWVTELPTATTRSGSAQMTCGYWLHHCHFLTYNYLVNVFFSLILKCFL